MLTDYEKIQYKMDQLIEKSDDLKRGHRWGMWSNWREFVKIDIQVNELKVKLLQLDNELLKDSLEGYKNEVDI